MWPLSNLLDTGEIRILVALGNMHNCQRLAPVNIPAAFGRTGLPHRSTAVWALAEAVGPWDERMVSVQAYEDAKTVGLLTAMADLTPMAYQMT